MIGSEWFSWRTARTRWPKVNGEWIGVAKGLGYGGWDLSKKHTCFCWIKKSRNKDVDDVYSIFQLRILQNIFLSTFIHHPYLRKLTMETKKLPISWKEIPNSKAPIFRDFRVVFGSVFWWFFCFQNEAWLLAGFTTPSLECHWWLLRGSLQVARPNLHVVHVSHLQPLVANMWGWEIFSNVLPPTQ